MKSQSEYPCEFVGTVANLTGYILPDDKKEYLEFGAVSQMPAHSGVFYIRLGDKGSSELSILVVRSLVNKVPIVLSFISKLPWDVNDEADSSASQIARAKARGARYERLYLEGSLSVWAGCCRPFDLTAAYRRGL